jgi:radical SAM protein with 4Fe4S-binding SPASM domain
MRKEIKVNLHSATIDITTGCNLHCKHCRLEKIQYNMSLDEIESICKKLHEYETRIMYISGGEPLFRHDIVEVVKLMKKYIPVITINTNSTLLNRKLTEDLIEAGTNYFQVSLDGLEAEHDEIRGKGTFIKTLENMELICEYIDKVKLHVSSVISLLNIDKMEEFTNFLINEQKLPIHILGFKRYIPKNVMKVKYNLGKEGLQKLSKNVNYLSEKYGKQTQIVCDSPIKNVFNDEEARRVMKKYNLKCLGCSAATAGPAIRADGSVSPCSLLDVSYGNLITDSIEDIYDSELFQSLVNRDLTGKCGECDYRLTCGGCRAAAFLLNGDHLSEDPECFI